MTSALRQRFSSAAFEAFDRRLLSPMVLGAILNPINSSIIAVSLVPIGVAFGAPASQTGLLVSALYLATSIGQPVVGRLIDSYGPRRLFLIGATLTGLAGVLGALSPDFALLVVARVVLGFGTCAGYPAAMYLIRSESRRTGRDSPAVVLTILSISSQTIVVIGPTLGGLLIGLGGWRLTFAINVPVALAALVLGWLRLPRTPIGRDRPRIDSTGIALFALTLVSLLGFLIDIRVDRVWLLAITAVAAVGFAVRELRTAQPFIDLRLLAGNVPLLLTYVRSLLSAVVSYSFLYGYTQWLEDGRGLSATSAGLILLPMSALAIVVSAITGRSPKVRAKLMVGQSLQLAACAMLLLLQPSSPIWLALLVTIVLGAPQGLNNLALQNAVYYQADAERIAASAGLLRSFFYLGAITSSAANGAFFGAKADTAGLHELGLFALGISAVGLLITVVDRSLARVGRPQPDPEPTDSEPALTAKEQ